jgi:hypothetical protein
MTQKQKTQNTQNEIKEAVFRFRGGIVIIPYTDPKTIERILKGVKMLRR